MFTTLDNKSLFIMPICFHPTTVMLVDDDKRLLEQLSLELSNYFPCEAFSDVDGAIKYFEEKRKDFIFKARLGKNNPNLVKAIRQEIYNKDRFKEMVVSIIDYDMPNKTGFDMMVTMGTPVSMAFHSYILFSGKPISDFNERLKQSSIGKNFISKSCRSYSRLNNN